jgi:hypothetical protein
MNVLEIMLFTWACIEITYCVPFLKSYRAMTDVVLAKLQKAISFEKGYATCNFYGCSEKTGVF